MTYEAICYYWKNTETDKIVYVGYHKTDDEHSDYYTASTTNPAFHYLWNKGDLERVVFYKGSVEKCISLEHYILSKMNAKNDPGMFNNTSGGGFGCDLSLVNEEMKALASEVISGKFTKNVNSHIELERVQLAQDILNKLKVNDNENYYTTTELYVGEIDNLPKIQVRFTQRLNHHINVIADRMSDPAEARKIVKPIVIVTFPNGLKKLLDGNHTLQAAIKAGWTTLKVVYIPAKEFNYDYAVMNNFGKLKNKEKEAKQGNSKDDVKKTIIELYERGTAFNSDVMKNVLHALYAGEYSPNSISALIVSVRNQYVAEERSSKYNFFSFSKELLAEYVNDYVIENPGHGCISQSADKVIFSGIGGVVNSFRQKSKGRNWNNPKGKIFIHYSNFDDWLDRDNLDKAIRDCLNIAKMDWVELEYLPCFINPETCELMYEPRDAKLAA